MEVKVIKPSFQIIEPHTPPEKRIAQMARICYRSEDQSSPESDARLIKNCVKSTHYSVTEHGFISVIFSNARIDMEKVKSLAPSIDDKVRITCDAIWNNFNSDTRRKYMEVFGDDEIYKLIDGPDSEQKTYNVYAGDCHTWLSLIDEFMSASLQRNFNLGFVFMLALVVKLNEAFPSVFANSVEQISAALSVCDDKNPLYKIAAGEEKDVKVTIDHFKKYFDMFEMIVAPACSRMTLSAILRTDRAVTHELVRHRRGVAYSQESQRYVNYGKKGYEVVWPQMDPVKYSGYTFSTVPHIPEGQSESVVEDISLEVDGYIPTKSSMYNTWLSAMELASSQYEALLATSMKKAIYKTDSDGGYVYDENGKPVIEKVETISVPPETARSVLPSSTATTIGVTWTPATFVNLCWRRIEKSAQWPIRYLLGNVLIQALKDSHPFFENFPPKLVEKWINDSFEMKIFVDEELKNKLIATQEKRQANIIKKLQDDMKRNAEMRAAEEARRNAEEAKPADEQKKDA